MSDENLYSYLKIKLTYKIGKMYFLLIIQKFLYLGIFISICHHWDTLPYIIALCFPLFEKGYGIFHGSKK